MKTASSKFYVLIVLVVLLTSCQNNTDDDTSLECSLSDVTLTLDPVCSFDPRIATTVQFPVRALVDGIIPSHDLYEYSWSKDPDFKGSAISVNYDQLPLELVITEKSTSCTIKATLENDYWD